MDKTCKPCKEKPLGDFPDAKDYKDKKNTNCRACHKANMAKYKESSKKSARAHHLRKYGLTQKDFDDILASQDGVCAICGGPPSVYDKYVVDHDHDTGGVRGLLCQHCNTGLGRFKDSKNLLDSAKKYIHDSRTNKFRELEIKMRVPRIGEAASFITWMSEVGADRYTRVTGQDIYWEREGTVIRHRLSGSDGGEVTLKNRRSSASTVDRVEIDLFLSELTNPEDVSAFLVLAGFKPTVAITKTSHIFGVDLEDCSITVVYYEVTDDLSNAPVQAYVEVEIDKDADIKISSATKILTEWQSRLIERGLEPMSDSLYEIYSGKKIPISCQGNGGKS